MYAVIRSGGKQYRVAPGDVIQVEKLAGAGPRLETSDVLAVRDDGGLRVAPKDVRITAEVVEQGGRAKCWSFTTSARSNTRSWRGTASRLPPCASPASK